MWIQILSDKGWVNHIAAEGPALRGHYDALVARYGQEKVRYSPEAKREKPEVECGCLAAKDGLALCSWHALENRRRETALRERISAEMENYIKSQSASLSPPVKTALRYWSNRIRAGGR